MHSTKPLISIIVPVYNRADIVDDTLASLASQTLRPLEVVLVDNASTDGSADVLERWQREQAASGIDVITGRCDVPGAAAARNAGLALAHGDMVMFFDSDDIMPPDHAAFAAGVAARYPRAEIIGWDCTVVEVDGRRRIAPFGRNNMQWRNLFGGMMATQRWCARRTLVEAVGAWREDIRYWDDIELGARMLAATDSVIYAGASGVEVRQRVVSVTGDYAAAPVSRIDAPLGAIADTLRPVMGRRADRWVDIKRAVELGVMARAGSSEAAALGGRLGTVAQKTAYIMTRAGLPGAARLLTLST